MEVSGKFHAPAALFIGKEPPVPITLKVGWPPEPVWTLWRKEKKCSAGYRTQAFPLVVRRYTYYSILIHYSDRRYIF
jgi:hypothetical protein